MEKRITTKIQARKVEPAMNQREHQRKWINEELQPLKDMLSARYDPQQRAAWVQFVEHVQESILKNPNQYLDFEVLPDSEILTDLVQTNFNQFLNNYRPGSDSCIKF